MWLDVKINNVWCFPLIMISVLALILINDILFDKAVWHWFKMLAYRIQLRLNEAFKGTAAAILEQSRRLSPILILKMDVR